MESLTERFNKQVFAHYVELLKAQYRIHPRFFHAKKMWEEKLTYKELVNGPYLEKSQSYAQGQPLDSLDLHEETVKTINEKLSYRDLWKHQTDAIKLIKDEKNAIIATGTSSGKTLCYQIPILNDLLCDSSSGLRAIIIYPLNALVNDQLKEWGEILKNHSHIRYARFTGQTPASKEHFEEQLRWTLKEQWSDKGLTTQQLDIKINQELERELNEIPQNCLTNREAIRSNPPHILITNFSMLEYLLVRPIDAPIFQNARLKFLVLDEAHSYRGIQATEIAFLVRRLKERLNIERVVCIATSATLGDQGNHESTKKVLDFASKLFGEIFDASNPIYGTPAEPVLVEKSFRPMPNQYLELADKLQNNEPVDFSKYSDVNLSDSSLTEALYHDENFYLLRKEILSKPILLNNAAKRLWPDNPNAYSGLQALLLICLFAKEGKAYIDLLPTRLHYFVKAQDGLHVCLHKDCPDRIDNEPAFFVSRNECPDGYCPSCEKEDLKSKLVEIVTCRKCGYLFGALQDLGPRRAQKETNNNESEPSFNSFSTELGWAGDSFWSYISVDNELPYPMHIQDEDDDKQDKLFKKPVELEWCVSCGKKKDQGRGDNCQCEKPYLRKIKIFHRQCPDDKTENLYNQTKKLLLQCPNCGARNASGIEPVRRFQESEDETGLAMAIPLAHFQVSSEKETPQLLCFTDHRQRAAAFPSLLEEETFSHDMGRKIVSIINENSQAIDCVTLGQKLWEAATPDSDNFDPNFFLPVSRLPDDDNIGDKDKRNLWIAETLSYFGIPDSARESAEDIGLVAVEYRVDNSDLTAFQALLSPYDLSYNEAHDLLQILLSYIRQRKAFTLPSGIYHDSPAFGRVTQDFYYNLRRDCDDYTIGWLPRIKNDGSYNDNIVTDYIRRLFNLNDKEILALGENIWNFMTSHHLLYKKRGLWKLDYERIHVIIPKSRHVCSRCRIVTAYSVRHTCSRKECNGRLENRQYSTTNANIISRWVAGEGEPQFRTLKSEEHTAQIRKNIAEEIEKGFRNETINLLSSTTTFEMGINIGDLQKVFLRNAPPSSANYVQRVGRAGRGMDKNSISVTMCRRTKYDADVWKDPPLIMSGKVRTPTVFTDNKLISQRHFNAVVFSKFMRLKFLENKLYKNNKQSIPIGLFINPEARKNIPERWMSFPPSVYLDFKGWLTQQKIDQIFKTNIGKSISTDISTYEESVSKSCDDYIDIFDKISSELDALMKERNKLHLEGLDTKDINNSINNLLNSDVVAVLAKNAFLPRYAFPLDVVSLETGKSKWSGDKKMTGEEVELSRDRSIAISEFAPGAQVIARKKVFTSAGLYIVSPKDQPETLWFSQCRGCGQIRTAKFKKDFESTCIVCEKKINSTQDIKPFVEPSAFSISLDDKEKGSVRFRRSTLIRQRQSVTHFIDNVEDDNFRDIGKFRLALKEAGTLFRYNLGPRNRGFVLCKECGKSDPKLLHKHGKSHKKLRSYSRQNKCSGQFLSHGINGIAYGHQFQSYCLIIRPTSQPTSVQSLAYSLQKGICNLLDLDPFDIGVSWRRLANRQTDSARAEIILYDNTPGGAGFVKDGRDNWQDVLKEALLCCDSCECELACYDCLKNYGNQTYHENLDRNTVIAFLSH